MFLSSKAATVRVPATVAVICCSDDKETNDLPLFSMDPVQHHTHVHGKCVSSANCIRL